MKDLSIVIVNYNVKAYLSNLLLSIQKATGDLDIKIFVVDNASIDGSAEYIKPRFPDVTFIENRNNVGFGKANNQVLPLLKSKYTLLLNPDALVSEDTLHTMVTFMDEHPDVGLSTCKLLNSDGSFSRDCIRNIPTPWSALMRVLGLAELFPNSKWTGSYFLAKEDPGKVIEVPIISGSFMMIRTDLFQELNGFDDRFFMYFEDTDLCYRVKERGYKIVYVPYTTIIHYRGESTRKNSLRQSLTFNKSLYQFYQKYYSYGYNLFFRYFILLGIFIKGSASSIITLFRKLVHPLIDLGVLNSLVILFFIWRYQIPPSSFISNYHIDFLSVNVLLSAFFIGSALYYDLYGKNRLSIPAAIKSTGIAFAGVVLITFFLRDFAFSRLILLLSAVTGGLLISGIRLIQLNRTRKAHNVPGSFLERRILLVGINEKSEKLIRKLRSRADWNYKIVGMVSQKSEHPVDEVDNIPVIGDLDSIVKLVEFYQVDEIIFTLPAVNHDQILKTISELQGMSVYPRIVPDSLDYIVGKTNVEYLDDIPVMDLNFPYFSRWNSSVKRILDLSGALIGAIVMTPFLAVPVAWNYRKRTTQNIHFSETGRHKIPLFLPYKKNRWKNRYLLVWYVFSGKISLVGGPIIPDRKPHFANVKPGLTGFRQLSENRLFHEDEKQQHELYYLQNYSVWMDIDILIKTVVFRRPTLEDIDRDK